MRKFYGYKTNCETMELINKELAEERIKELEEAGIDDNTIEIQDGVIIELSKEEEELQKCIDSPYYFMTKYCLVNGEPYQTCMSEEEFNKLYLNYENK